MTKGKRTTAIALAGAVALASGAYALGAPGRHGSAEAAKNAAGRGANRPRLRPGRPGLGMRPGFDGLADRLGVDEAELRAALEDIAADRKDDFAQRLADALGIDAAKVEQAFENVRPERPASARVAPRPAGVRRARSPRSSASAPRRCAPRSRSAAGAPATRATSPTSSASARSGCARPSTPSSASIRPHRPGLANLAEELGVTQAQLEAAFEKLRDQKDELRDEFAKELADRLNLDAAKVQDALDALHPPRMHGPRGRACSAGGSASRSGSSG